MKLTNGEIFVAREPLANLMERKFPVKVSYSLVKLAKALQEQLTVIEEVRTGLIKTYSVVDPKNPNNLSVPPTSEDFPKFIGELNELFGQEVEVVFDKVKLPEKVAATCDKCNHNMDKMLEIEPSILVALQPFIEVE